MYEFDADVSLTETRTASVHRHREHHSIQWKHLKRCIIFTCASIKEKPKENPLQHLISYPMPRDANTLIPRSIPRLKKDISPFQTLRQTPLLIFEPSSLSPRDADLAGCNV